eukprot:5474083-Pleurochrysis_carterae.AAC.3
MCTCSLGRRRIESDSGCPCADECPTAMTGKIISAVARQEGLPCAATAIQAKAKKGVERSPEWMPPDAALPSGAFERRTERATRTAAGS